MGSKLIVFVVLGVASLLLHSSKATDYEVGDSTGWKAPSDTSFYSTWASGKNFTVGDTLKFTFTTGVHDVATVSKSDYDSCNINVTTVLEVKNYPLPWLPAALPPPLPPTIHPLHPLTTRYTAYNFIFLSAAATIAAAAIALSFLESRCYLGFGVYVHCHKFHALLVGHVTVAVFWCFAIQHRWCA
ncbi:BLUE COPPER PROTEIN [Salix viminalis]|uniref:BLUE COPPER PROTEIN n=1 Tax=Salix viminalis TaxID=40686 RepID=A0A9Q0NNV1_SALVM|nr:BLUE COPPER PROTEIN [Salix viminalis]